MRARHLAAAVLALMPAIPAHANETRTYTYDAKGRLTAVSTSGGPANGASTSYTFDAADNRTNVATTGATNRVIVVPNGVGFKLILPN